jgi:hypothetical protein
MFPWSFVFFSVKCLVIRLSWGAYSLEQAFLCLLALYNSVQQDSLAFSLFKGVCSLCLVMSVYMYCWSPACYFIYTILTFDKKKELSVAPVLRENLERDVLLP